ncbi:tyrosine-type recombinase/integrase [Aliiglaciecola sp. SL4]|uniref:tyrosine-type recombinase/integrase n=1 Tax=Aliiglaciecola sp. SL4 TaxID=3239806 RepID=UPI00355BDD07
MSFSENVEVIPPPFSTESSDRRSEEESKKLQKQKWWVLSISFLLVFVVAMIWIWSRSPIYQSQAIIHFSYAQQLNNQQTAVPEEQITLNNKRLTSNRILDGLRVQLADEYSLNFTTEELAQMVSTEEHLDSRIINLFTTGENRNHLQPVLEQWLALYLARLEEETEENTVEDLSLGQEKLLALEQKILEQRDLVEQYSEENNIISMERDENRALSKIKSMGAALDTAETQQAEAKATLESVKQSIAQGDSVIHPGDKARLDGIRSAIKDSEAELYELSQRYTAEYMELDPSIVNKKRRLQELKTRYEAEAAESQKRFVEDLQRTVVASEQKQKQLEIQLDELGKEALVFNQKLKEYGRLNRSLSQLQEQAQQLKDQLVETEVQKPFQAKINVLEQPFVPTYPISPNYWRDSAIALAAAVLVSLFALLIFSFIHRQKTPAPTMTSYNVVPPSSGLTLEQQVAAQQALEQQKQAQLGHQQAPLQLAQASTPKAARLLSEAECGSLYQVANRDGKLAISLILNGVSPSELLNLKVQDIDLETQSLQISGEYARSVPVSPECIQIIQNLQTNQAEDSLLLGGRLDAQQLDQMMINIAHDAGLAFAEQFSIGALRHTYLTFLVAQGARLNDLEQVAGFVSPNDLSLYRQVNRRGEPVDVEQLNLQYPLA